VTEAVASAGIRLVRFGGVARELISRVARAAPTGLGQPFTTWSLSTLTAYLREHYRLMVSAETVRRVLRQAGITWQRTKMWKTSKDPDFATKMARILNLYDHPPATAGCCAWTSSGHSTCNRDPATAGFGAANQPDCARPTPARTGCGRCSPRSIWPAARCSTGSVTVNAGRSSSTSVQLRRRFPTGSCI
jgi:hypothetical protein